MISNYEIKNYNGEEILYLYFDFNYEISKEEFKKETIENTIKDFITKNKISFKGTTILLISCGVLFGNINLNKLNQTIKPIKNETTYEEKIDSNINTQEDTNTKENIEIPNTKEITKKEQNSTTNNKNTSNIKIADNKIIKKETNEDKTNQEKSTNKTTEENMPQTNEQPQQEIISQTNEPKKEIIDNNIYINVRRTNGNTIKLELEEYIIGVVGAEMPASFNIEALKAQAIIARTYALKANSKNQTLSDNESTQSYKNNDELKNIWGESYNTYHNKIKEAVESTRGAYLTYNGNYIEAVYHSTSNGKTESSENVWGNYYPYLVSVDSPFDSSNPSYEMSKNITYDELSNRLGIEINNETGFDILGYTIGGRVSTIKVSNNNYTGIQFRNLLGLRSADFDITQTETGITINTRGYGHGVGLSQYGANGMAKNGYSYKDILKHYYTGVSISYL